MIFRLSKRSIAIALLLVISLSAWGAYALLPIGFPDAARYFDPLDERRLQADELGQLRSVEETFYNLSLSGDDFKGWSTEHRHFWKYSIAFAAYGLPSAMIIDPQNTDRYQAMMDMMIWKMKSKKVWSDFTERGFGSDPISVQNIMYKGHLNLMYGLYQLSTGDQRYAREYTWLTNQIAAEMRLHHQGKYEGVTCEPNAWFVECNVIGMLSLHVYDRLYGTQYTENEVQWTLDFIMQRMRDPDTGLFYRAYLPNHDLVKEQIGGYANAWILTFMTPFAEDKARELYPSFKQHLVEELGPYAGVRLQTGGEPDQVAQIFGLWAAKEFDDVALFGKLRNAADKFGKLQEEPDSAGLAYADPNSVLINGVIVASKLHLGWNTVLNHSWASYSSKLEIPDTEHMSWTDILPTRTYAMNDDLALPSSSTLRPCPSCFWGDYRSTRMRVEAEQQRCLAGGTQCDLNKMNEPLLERPLTE